MTKTLTSEQEQVFRPLRDALSALLGDGCGSKPVPVSAWGDVDQLFYDNGWRRFFDCNGQCRFYLYSADGTPAKTVWFGYEKFVNGEVLRFNLEAEATPEELAAIKSSRATNGTVAA